MRNIVAADVGGTETRGPELAEDLLTFGDRRLMGNDVEMAAHIEGWGCLRASRIGRREQEESEEGDNGGEPHGCSRSGGTSLRHEGKGSLAARETRQRTALAGCGLAPSTTTILTL